VRPMHSLCAGSSAVLRDFLTKQPSDRDMDRAGQRINLRQHMVGPFVLSGSICETITIHIRNATPYHKWNK
jgi:hypothetical protein